MSAWDWICWYLREKGMILMVGIMCVAAVLFISACAGPGAGSRQFIIDSRGVDQNRYQADLADCQRYAQQVPGVGTQAAAGAIAGAAAGALLSRLIGRDVARGPSARVGAATGAASGAVRGVEQEQQVVRQCLRGRGYSVLN